MKGAFPAYLDPLLERLGVEATSNPTCIDGVDVLLYTTGEKVESLPKKALCIVPSIPTSQHDGIIGCINRLGSFYVECVIFANGSSLHVYDLAGLRGITVDVSKLDGYKIDCICRYANSGHVVFLDPLFDDPGFLKQCWAAFSSNLEVLESAGLRDREQRVRFALQMVIELCLKAWKILPPHASLVKVTGEQSTHAQIGTQSFSIDGVTLYPRELAKTRKDVGATPWNVDEATLDALAAPWCSISCLEAQIDERIVCFLMEQSILGHEKKRTGSYFTPRTWAWYTCHKSLQTFGAMKDRDGDTFQFGAHDLQRLEILDPAMGSGDFLDAMSLNLVDAWLPLLFGSRLEKAVDWNALRLRAKLEHVFSHNLHGIDLNQLAVDVTRARFFLNAIKHVSRDPSLAKMMEGFSIDLVLDDFLTRKVDHAYDIIIGNPPYLMEVRNNQALFRQYSKHPATRDRYEPKMDVFYFFMFKGIEMLRDRGIMGFVVQEYWLDRYHARHIRQFMFQEASIADLVLFKECKVFPTAPGQHTMILVARRGKATHDDEARIITVRDACNADISLLGELLVGTGNHIDVHYVPNHAMYDAGKDKVFVSGDDEQGFFERMHAIKHHAIDEDEIQVGINIPQPFVRRGGKVEGVFVVPRDQAPRIANAPEEQAILKPFHMATDIGAYTFSIRENHFLIYTTNESMKRVEKDHETYARIRAHLDKFAGVITSDHKPYGLHRPRQQEWFESRDKIIGVRKTRSPKFAVVPQDYYMDQATLFIRLDPVGMISPHYACAFLNSPAASRVLSSIKMQGRQLQIDKNVLTRLPIPVCHAIDHQIISTLSIWLHVLGIMKEDHQALVDDTLITRIRGIIDGFFDRLVSQEGKEPLLASDDISDIPRIALEEHLIKRRCIDGLEHLESTVINVEGLRASITPLLPSLERVISQLASRDG